MDRNFDTLAERFEQRVYGGLKGEVRLAVIWRDLLPLLERLEKKSQPLKILDIGGGLAQISIELAKRGHSVAYNDISPVMLGKAQRRAQEAGIEQQFSWQCGNYYDLSRQSSYDLVLCHALLEWLQHPQRLIGFVAQQLAPCGVFSLCFYNPAAKIYRNLIRGNFDWLVRSSDYCSDSGSLTPNNPCETEQVREWLGDAEFNILSTSGIRVFHDYVVEKRGGHQSPAAVLDMELQYSALEPYKWLGRYLHMLAQREV